MGRRELIASLAFSITFSIALAYASIEVIRIVNLWMLGFIPDCVLLSDFPRCQELEALFRLVGYAGLAAILLVTVAGFLLKKTRLALLGSLAIYLPTIGYFAFTMFFLAGVGVLRLLWLPFTDSDVFVRIGLITFLPAWFVNTAVTWAVKLAAPGFTGDFSAPVGFVFMITGLALFILATFTWVSDRLRGKVLSTEGVYKFSRHPMYLGFIIWSYGLLYLASTVEGGRGWSPPAPGLPWLLSAVIIIGAALLEEAELRSKVGEYVKYAEHTPFMIPLPRRLGKAITYPVRKLIGKDLPDTRREVLTAMLVYLALTSLISLAVSYFII
ncbi:DUF1295 domain-containing protein [Thermosphaera chiliense]|uniref:DUF1295 domain-containing protein n=1 Tax=Thermosphaera chiliense TaxID=3402707 RepID=A0A7M1USG1_9CREN|nr:DUF1295 domain-containing protein [Thermosphaera aggregans]QOR94467.1 DUF1295 domain-containing protein [Thermosphaera aggregans]